MTERREYSDEVKAAVMAALLAGNTVNYVADQFNIPRGTVKFWRAKMPPTTVDPKKEAELANRLDNLLLASLDTLAAQVRLYGNEEWLKEQRAGELGLLFGIIADKTVRLLEARQAASQEEEEEYPVIDV